METLIVIAVVGLSLVYLIKRAWTTVFKQQDSSCSCGCSGCSSEADSTDMSNTVSEGNSK